MQLIHYSAIPVELDDREYCNAYPEPRIPGGKLSNYKPNGFWVSVDGNGDSWKNFIEREELPSFQQGSLKYAHEVTLCADANILYIQSVKDMREFAKAYKHDYQYPGLSYVFRTIHWDCVASEYQGIIIAPYRYELRLHPHFHWYYTWDCASGAIWDISAIAKIEVK